MPLRRLYLGIFAAALVALLPQGVRAENDPDAVHIQIVIGDVWADATATWEKILGGSLYQSDVPQLNFVPKVNSSHCYGLYINPGPVYCSGNATVFVSVAAMKDISRRYPQMGDVGLAFLVAHELGHHVQKLTGRFRLLSRLMRAEPERQREIALRFELEADCLAGVWVAQSPRFAAAGDARDGMLRSIEAIGDDKVLATPEARANPAVYTHGSAAQRTAWFKRGLHGGAAAVCDALSNSREAR